MISRNFLRGSSRWAATAVSAAAQSTRPGLSRFSRDVKAPILCLLATRDHRSQESRSLRAFTSSAASKQKVTPSYEQSAKHQYRRRRRWGLAATVVATVVVLYLGREGDTPLTQVLAVALRGRPLNERSFEPFTIVAREQVSATSFVITVQPSKSLELSKGSFVAGLCEDSHSNKPVFRRAWDHGLWHVEVKHPLIQVAREYTPLPPREGQEEHDLDRGYLRFLIRTVDGGEVSHYLAGLGLGDKIELRGPHLGFDVRARLGDAGQLVFLAGGTGIAPALQVVHALLDREPGVGAANPPRPPVMPVVSIIWANRRSSDCQGCHALTSGLNTRAARSEEYPNTVVCQLAEMQRRHRGRLDVTCTVDSEGKFIGAAAITATANNRPAELPNSPPMKAEEKCPYHAPAKLLNSDGKDPADGACICNGPHATTSHGKKLLMVSGPEGFIAAFAGPKRWEEGKERQGVVGGLLGQLRARYPAFWSDWLVLKL